MPSGPSAIEAARRQLVTELSSASVPSLATAPSNHSGVCPPKSYGEARRGDTGWCIT